MTYIIASLIVLAFTVILTIAGVGPAFILIPTFYWLGIPLTEAMAVALLLNSIGMTVASANYIKGKLVVFRTALPIIILAVIFSPLGAYSAHLFPKKLLILLFVLFLIFAGSMMLFYRPKEKSQETSSARKELLVGIGLGIFAGYLGGLLGVGGGNFIIPVLIWLGFNPKKASGTTAFIVIFSSLSGFFGHVSLGNINARLLIFTAIGSIVGAIVGSWLMRSKLQPAQVKKVIGIVLYAIAVKMATGLF
ncbi:MAG: sulfite exporter TauE/SafE family protein [Candidatus Aminicenantales bacterium]